MDYVKTASRADVFIGHGAGKRLLSEINGARKSIRLVSPRLSAALIQSLVAARQRGVEVALVTMDRLADEGGLDEREIILQKRETNEPRYKVRKRLLIAMIAVCLAAGAGGLALSLQGGGPGWIYPSGVAAVAALFGLVVRLIPVYSFSYETLFRLRVVIGKSATAQKRTEFDLNANVYVIDNKVAFLGSLSFTQAGQEENWESVVRLRDPGAVQAIGRGIDAIFDDSEIVVASVEDWGRKLYPERRF